jgi:hypothetical protein
LSETEDVVICDRENAVNWIVSTSCDPLDLQEVSRVVVARSKLSPEAESDGYSILHGALGWARTDELLKAKDAKRNQSLSSIMDKCSKYMIWATGGDKLSAEFKETARIVADKIATLIPWCGDETSPTISDCIRRGAAIVYLIGNEPDEAELLNAELAMRQFVRKYNHDRKIEYFWDYLKNKKFTVIIDNLPGIFPQAVDDVCKWLELCDKRSLCFAVGLKTLASGAAQNFMKLAGDSF